eukprot:6492706-Amphidinium_carterae.3
MFRRSITAVCSRGTIMLQYFSAQQSIQNNIVNTTKKPASRLMQREQLMQTIVHTCAHGCTTAILCTLGQHNVYNDIGSSAQ